MLVAFYPGLFCIFSFARICRLIPLLKIKVYIAKFSAKIDIKIEPSNFYLITLYSIYNGSLVYY